MTTPNSQAQFTNAGRVSGCSVTAGNTNSEGTGTIGTDTFVVLQAGANGSYVENVRWMPTASTPTSTTATVGRLYKSTKTSGATTGGTDTFLIAEVTLQSENADSASAQVQPVDVPLPGNGFRLGANETLLAQNNVAPAANSAWQCVAYGGDY